MKTNLDYPRKMEWNWNLAEKWFQNKRNWEPKSWGWESLHSLRLRFFLTSLVFHPSIYFLTFPKTQLESFKISRFTYKLASQHSREKNQRERERGSSQLHDACWITISRGNSSCHPQPLNHVAQNLVMTCPQICLVLPCMSPYTM